MEIFGVKVTAPTLPSIKQVRDTVGHGVQHAREFGAGAANAARNLGRQGVDLGRRAVADPEGTVRSLAAGARKGINDATEAARGGISSAVNANGHIVHAVADRARAAVSGDGVGSRLARNAITGVENHVRMNVSVAGGVLKGVTSMVGGVGSLAVTAAELNASPAARAELDKAASGLLHKGGQAVEHYARAVAADPGRVTGDLQGGASAVWKAGSGFVESQVRNYEAAAARGEGIEHIGMGVGEIDSNFIPFGAGARGAAIAGRGAEAAATGARLLAREGMEGLAAQGARGLASEGGESALRAAGAETRVTTLAATPAVREAAEAAGAKLLRGAEAGGGTVRVARNGGLTAQDLAAASRQSGREVALYRDLASGERYVTVGTRTGAQVPEGSRLIAHTQPGTGAAAVRASVADEVAISRLGQRSSVIIDDGGTASTRFRATEANTDVVRMEAGTVRLHAPNAATAANDAAIAAAKADQVKWGYAADDWGVMELKAGDKILGGLPGQSAYYSNASTLNAAGNSRVSFFESLQVKPHAQFGYRPKIGEYEVVKDMTVPFGTAQANPSFGSGGGSQFFVDDYASSLRLLREIPLGQ